jgi:hypothetical protein
VGLLRPLGHLPDESKLNGFELEVLEELARLPRESDRVTEGGWRAALFCTSASSR